MAPRSPALACPQVRSDTTPGPRLRTKAEPIRPLILPLRACHCSTTVRTVSRPKSTKRDRVVRTSPLILPLFPVQIHWLPEKVNGAIRISVVSPTALNHAPAVHTRFPPLKYQKNR